MDSHKNQCGHTEGILLLKKICPEMVVATCVQCRKSVCRKHTREIDGYYYCIKCATSTQGTSYEKSYYDPDHGRNRSNPFGYSIIHYAGWGYYGGSFYGSRYQNELNQQSEGPLPIEPIQINDTSIGSDSDLRIESDDNTDKEILGHEMFQGSYPEDFEDGDGESFMDTDYAELDSVEGNGFENDIDAS